MSMKKDRPESREPESTIMPSMSMNEENVYQICCTLKNLSANKKVRRDLLK